MDWKVLFCLCLAISLSYSIKLPDGFDKNVCTPFLDDGGRAFPDVPDEYYTKLEWNDAIAKQSYYMEEYVSQTMNAGTIFVTGLIVPDKTAQWITDANTGEVFLIYDTSRVEYEDGNCAVYNIADTQEFSLPYKKDGSGKMSLMSGKSLLNLGADPVGFLNYNGTETVNGISCDKWQGCLFLNKGKVTIKAEYWFSRNDSDARWYMAGGDPSVPVMIHVSGSSKDDKNYQLEQTFNYAYFSSVWPSVNAEAFASIFQTPLHVFCEGRKITQDLPEVPSHFSFRAEIIDNIAKTVTYTEEWYDFEGNYTRMDFKQAPTGNDTEDSTITPKTLINDFNNGVSYLLDRFTGECAGLPIVGGEFDSVDVGNGKIRMRSPKEFFDFDAYPYQYMGQHVVRDVLSNAWITVRPYPDPSSKINATWEWFFAVNETIIKVQDLAEDVEPLRATIKSSQANVDQTYNFYKFSENTPDPKVFDVSLCYSTSNSVSFELKLQGNWSDFDAQDQQQLLSYWLRLSVEAFAGVRALRVQNVEFTFGEKYITTRFTLLGPTEIQGDVDNDVGETSLNEASDMLTEAISDGLFQVYFMGDPDKGATLLTAVPKSLRVIQRRRNPGSYRPKDSPLAQKTVVGPGLSAGGAAGLGIGMFFLGVIIAAVFIFLYTKNIKGGSRPYRRQANDHE